MARSRLEDLGRLSERINYMLDMEGFSLLERTKPKWYIDKFFSLPIEDQHDHLHALLYGLESLREQLYEALLICNGQDALNDNTNDHHD